MAERIIKSFGEYFNEYGPADKTNVSGDCFYNDVLRLAKMEDEFSRRQPNDEEARKYIELGEDILEQCDNGTNIEDLIGLVVVGEVFMRSRKKVRVDRIRTFLNRNRGDDETDQVLNEEFVPQIVVDFYKRIKIPLFPTNYAL